MKPDPSTVLLAGNDGPDMDGLASLLASAGYATLRARTGSEALDLLATHSIDSIVCEARLPEMRGAQLLERVAALSSCWLWRRWFYICGEGALRFTSAPVAPWNATSWTLPRHCHRHLCSRLTACSTILKRPHPERYKRSQKYLAVHSFIPELCRPLP